MANIKSAKKRIKVINKKTLLNKMTKSQTKTEIKKALAAVESGDKAQAEVAVKAAISRIARSESKGVYHKNTETRKISRLQRMLNNME